MSRKRVFLLARDPDMASTSRRRIDSGSSDSDDDSEEDGFLGGMFSGKEKEQEEPEHEDRGTGWVVDESEKTESASYQAVPSMAADYGNTAFWDGRYMTLGATTMEWYHPWINLATSLRHYIDKNDKILVVGCGNSEMSADMYAEGYRNITNLDVSRVVIDQMQTKYPADQYPGMTWVAMDARLTDFPPSYFDIVLDKACLDSILCTFSGQSRSIKFLRETDRVLKEDGAYICVSYGLPEHRLGMLELWDLETPFESYPWDVHVDAVARRTQKLHEFLDMKAPDSYNFVYVCIKDPKKVDMRLLNMKRAQLEQEKKLKKMAGRKARQMRKK